MNSNLSLPPSVHERLSGWVQIQERRTRAPEPQRPGPTITLSRQFGCEGFPLALCLEERLNAECGEPWHVFDKALIEKVAQEEGIPFRLLDSLGDANRGLEGFGFHPGGKVTNDEAFAKVAQTLVKIARQGHAVIVGRGGAVLCRDLENCFHFRIEAGFPWRVASLMERMGIGREAAENQVKIHSRARDRFLEDNLGVGPADRGLYDAVFNNERHGVAEIAAAILAYVRSGWKGSAGARDVIRP